MPKMSIRESFYTSETFSEKPVFSHRPFPGVTENGKSVFIHPLGVIENRFSDFTFLLISDSPPSFPANYQYCDILHTWGQMNYRACNKNEPLTISTLKFYRCWHLQFTFSKKKSTVTQILQALTVTVDFFQKKLNCSCKKSWL